MKEARPGNQAKRFSLAQRAVAELLRFVLEISYVLWEQSLKPKTERRFKNKKTARRDDQNDASQEMKNRQSRVAGG
jgi:hypothetical protein